MLSTDDGFALATDYAIGDYGALFRLTNTTSAGPNSLQLKDINNNGYLDILTANESDNSISVLLNRGDGTFIEQANYSVGEHPTGLTLEDFNQDSFLDVAVANSSSSTGLISILDIIGNSEKGI